MRQDELRRQARQHLDSLRSAGVEWLPKGTVLEASRSTLAPCVAEAPSPPSAASLIDREDSARVVAAAATPVLQQRRRELEVLRESVAGCSHCAELASTRTQTVFGVGALEPELCFVGEAPGADEDAQGEPFVGAAGQLLNRIIAACGLRREEVYICNIIKCRPPGNRTPLPSEAANCRAFLERQLELVRPRFLCALGSTAATYLLGTTQPIGKLRGRFHDYRGIPVICTYHPAYLLPHRSPDKKKDVWEDMKMLLTRMGRPIPATGKN